MTITFLSKESLIDRHLHRIKEWAFRKLTSKASPLFLKGGDSISIAPWVLGGHELRITSLIDSFARQGYGGYFIDIGANIGLISCQSGNNFRQVHMFEPNPDCCNIIRVNTRIALDKCRAVLHPVGLGSAKETAALNVPRHNWGGAFVYSPDNAYDHAQLASKDGYGSFDLANYMQVEISIEPAKDELKTLFAGLERDGCRSGVIKIDVEGCESMIIEAVAATLPADFKAMLIFEYLDPAFDPVPLLERFGGRAVAMKLVRMPPKRMSRLKRAWRIVMDGGYRYVLHPFSSGDSSTDIVFLVSEQAPAG